MSVFICGGDYIYRQTFGQCYGACRISDSALLRSEGSPYYGPTWVCTNCGDRWSEELYSRPFVRGWRQRSIEEVVARWDRACACPVERDSDFYPVACEHDLAEAS